VVARGGLLACVSRYLHPPPPRLSAYTETHAAGAREEAERERERQRAIDRARDTLTVGMGPGKSVRMQAITRRRRVRDEEFGLQLTPTERHFFERVRGALGTRELWVEFLKCLDLYAAEVLQRTELLQLLADVFGTGNAGLLEELKTLLNNRGMLEMTVSRRTYRTCAVRARPCPHRRHWCVPARPLRPCAA